jgi:ABC-type ATPase fused to a predicted acetyltransferase domain
MRRQRDFRIRQFRRIYDRTEGKFTFNISYETHTKPTPRSLVVAEAFGLGIDEAQKFKVLDAELKIGPQDIVYITGDSGSGKSVLLRAIRVDLGEEAIDLSEVAVDPEKPLIETVGATVEQGLELLSKVGLNDAFLFLRPYSQLSDGQKYRYRIAKLIESGKQWWLMDEFAACLDRDTAKIIAYNLQKIARQQGKAVIAATTHSDLYEDFKPSVLVRKRFGEEIHIDYYPNSPATECSLTKEMKIKEGTRDDWQKLSRFHYRGHKIAVPRKIFRLVRGDELCGVIVYSYPPPACYGRRLVLPRMSIQEMNKQLSIINRVVVHPKYRTIGLGTKLIHDTLPMVDTSYVELIAVMPKYSPFAEKAGMQKIVEQQTVKSISSITKTLQELGFDFQLLGSERYVQEKLQRLSSKQLSQLKSTFIKNKHPRFKKEFAGSRHQPFGKTSDYIKCIKNADLAEIAKLVKLVSMLLQTKVYLFWKKEAPLSCETSRVLMHSSYAADQGKN